MGRKKNEDDHFIEKEMSKVIHCITVTGTKTWDDLFEVALQFCLKNFQHAKDVADGWGVAPIHLLTVALLNVEHPLLVKDGYCNGYLAMHADIIKAKIERWDLAVPLKNPQIASTWGVERKRESVERNEN